MRSIFVMLWLIAGNAIGQEKCPDRIEDTIGIFSSDREAQENYFIYPLSFENIDKTKTEFPTRKTLLSKDEVKDRTQPVFPLLEQQKAYGLERSVKKLSSSEAEVVLSKPDTDFVLIYKFRKDKECWWLYSHSDYSL